MRFVHPQFLFALFALAIPILVHLFNFRRFKRVLFTNVRFLQEIKQDTRHRSRLKHLLVLASRLLALAFLVLAFAQPYLPAEKGTSRASRNRVSIWIDNSFSMEARGTYGPLLEVARERARELVLSYPAADRFQLLTNDFEARDQRFVTREEFLQRLDEIRPTSAVRTLLEVAKRQQGAFASEAKANGEEFSAFFLSDFQSSLAGDGQLPADTNLRRYVVPFTAAAVANLSIDSCYLNTPYIQPGSTQELTVRLHNFGDKDLTDVPLKLHVNGSQRALSAVSVSGQSTTEIKLPFSISTTGFQQAVVSVTDHPVTFDDTFNFAFNVRPDVKVLCINGEARSSHIDALFANDAYFVYRTFSETQVDYNNLSSQQLVILNGLRSYASGLQESLRKYVENGGTLLVVPSTSTDVTAFNRFAAALSMPVLGASANDSVKVGRMETEHPMLSGVFEKGTAGTENLDLPLVHKYFKLNQPASGSWQPVLRLENGNPFLVETVSGNGSCFTLAVPLESSYSNFQQHALFVPVFLKAALMRASEIGSGCITGMYAEFSAGDSLLPGDQVYHVLNKASGFDAIPEVRRNGGSVMLSLQDQVQAAGNYEVQAGKTTVNVVAFNYDRKESDLRVMDASKLEAVFGSASQQTEYLDADDQTIGHSLAKLREGVSLWKYCIAITLIFLLIEILLIRYFKR